MHKQLQKFTRNILGITAFVAAANTQSLAQTTNNNCDYFLTYGTSSNHLVVQDCNNNITQNIRILKEKQDCYNFEKPAKLHMGQLTYTSNGFITTKNLFQLIHINKDLKREMLSTGVFNDVDFNLTPDKETPATRSIMFDYNKAGSVVREYTADYKPYATQRVCAYN